jgi:uncharacterized metal-binding protein YceD (DUF177 family)
MKGVHGFHRPQSLAALPDAGLEATLEAKPSERKSLADYLDVVSVEALSGQLLLQRWRGQGVRVTGRITARLTQNCVVTLEPLNVAVVAEVDRKFLPDSMLARDADPHEMLIDPDGEDPPEPLPHSLDLGELAAEELALNIDPYPRKLGAEEAPPHDIVAPANPFSVLKGTTKG